jgi:lysyl-tRNA synthetase class 2
MAVRGHGKTIFATLRDEGDTLQIYLRKDDLGDKFDLFDNFDIGDFLGVRGPVFKTKTGEITVMAREFELLSKSMKPLPEKWHGLTDVEVRYRKRYLDLIANPEIRDVFKKRSRLIGVIREFFDRRGFLEVETPILQAIYGGAAARPFKTFYNALDQEMFLRIADELYLKRLIVGGYEKVWEFCRDFRNEGVDRFHNPEFSMIEAYQAYTDYLGIMDLVEALFSHITAEMLPEPKITFHGKTVSLITPFRRLSYTEALNEKLGFDALHAPPDKIDDACRKIGLDPKDLAPGFKIDKLFSELIQDHLEEPTFVIDHPKLISPLAKVHRNNPDLVERFELVILGTELANAFSELNDPADQRRRFEAQLAQKEEGIGEIDQDYIEALEYGMPPTGGLGIGIDRLCMLILGQSSLRDVILFPQLRKEAGH